MTICWSVPAPEHGDIIVFEFPDNPDVDYIKRVIGVPGDVIEVRDKEVYRNGQRLEEPYAVHGDPRLPDAPGTTSAL